MSRRSVKRNYTPDGSRGPRGRLGHVVGRWVNPNQPGERHRTRRDALRARDHRDADVQPMLIRRRVRL